MSFHFPYKKGHKIVATAAIHIISKHFIPAEFILFTDTALTNNMHHPNIIIQLFAHNNIISVEACLILSLTYKLHTEMIHINLTPNTEEGWADKVLKTNLWPINLDTWAALKASENEIFFVEDDVEPNIEGQFNDIPTKLELRTNDLCTHLINKSLLKEFMLIKFGRGYRGGGRISRTFRLRCRCLLVKIAPRAQPTHVHTCPHMWAPSCPAWGGALGEGS